MMTDLLTRLIGADGLLNTALVLSAVLLVITLIVCWTLSGRNKQ